MIKVSYVWIMKYSKPVYLGCDNGTGKRINKENMYKNDVEIIKGHVLSDYMYLFVLVPLQMAVFELVQYMEGNFKETDGCDKSVVAAILGSSYVCGDILLPV